MKHFFNDPITIYNEASRDQYGRQVWSDGEAVNCRFVEVNKVIYSSKGESVMSDALIHLSSDVTITLGSKIVFDAVKYRVISLKKPKDQFNVRFIKVYLQILHEDE